MVGQGWTAMMCEAVSNHLAELKYEEEFVLNYEAASLNRTVIWRGTQQSPEEFTQIVRQWADPERR